MLEGEVLHVAVNALQLAEDGQADVQDTALVLHDQEAAEVGRLERRVVM